MKTLYLKIIELLESIEYYKYIDLDISQLQEEKPSITYPAALIKISVPQIEEIQHLFQLKNATVQITLVEKFFSETNNIAPIEVREKGLNYYNKCEEVSQLLQGYKDDQFESFSVISINDVTIRKGLKTVVLQLRTSWKEHIAK